MTAATHTYAIGVERRPQQFHLIAGPSPSLADMLAVRAADERAVVFEYIGPFSSAGHDRILYRWRGDGWEAA